VRAFQEISRETLKEKIEEREENFTLIDVRGRADYSDAHLPQAIEIPLDDIELMVPRLVPNLWEDIVVYCGGPQCEASGKAAQLLTDLGYKNVKRYRGGTSDWIAADLPVEAIDRLSDEAA
jgi:rhodanese-related sulfurtransferase